MIFHPHASSSAGNLYEVRSGGARLVIDPGLPIAKVKAALGFRLSDVAGVLVSHSHADHCRAAPGLAASGLDIYGSTETLAAVGLSDHHRAHVLEPGGSYWAGPFRVLPFATRHDAAGSLGFYVGHPDGDRLLYAIDTAYVPSRAAGLTHIAVECNYSLDGLRESTAHPAHVHRVQVSHMGLERVLLWLGRTDLSRVREIHLLHLSDGHGDAEGFRAAVEQRTGRPVVVAGR